MLVPRRNEADLDELPADVRAEMEVIPVDSMEEVLALALRPAAVADASTAA